jgi:molybdopterin-dependent oxidoreductase alpha subunit
MRKLKSGGGWQAVRYSLKMGREVGYLPFWRAINSNNACKTCALGMGGQQGGMRNEAGHWPEVCKKSLQAMAADMRGRIDPEFFRTYSIEQLKTLSPRELEALGRLGNPIYAAPGDTHFRIIDWNVAIEGISQAMRASKPEKSFFYASGRSSNEAGFVLQLMARAFGTNHVNNCSYYCHQASGVGLNGSIGSGTATVEFDDLEECDLVFVIGGNPPSNHPRLMTSLMKLRNRGGVVVIVNPMKEIGLESFRVPSRPLSMLLGSDIASHYLQVKIGGDIALLAGIAKSLLEKGGVEDSYVEQFTEGYVAVRELVEATSWDRIVQDSGLSREQIETVADAYRASKGSIFSWTMGITHHEHGVENVQWIVNLALMRGMVGKPGAGLMPIRGHSNVQGMGTIGVSPAVSKAAVEGMAKIGVPVPEFKGYDTLAMLEASLRGEMTFGFCLGGNLFGASPDAQFASGAIGSVNTMVYLNTTLNTGHAHGLGKHTYILPVLARDEEKQSTTQESMFNFVRLSDGGIDRYDGLFSEVEIIADIAHEVLGDGGAIDWQKMHDHNEIRRVIAMLVPSLAKIESIGQTKKEFSVDGRVLHEPKFKTESGRASFHAHALPEHAPLKPNEIRVMTVRSEGQFNTVVYEETDIYRGQERRDVILMNAKEIARLGLKVDQPVRVSNATGVLHRILVREYDLADGAAVMYYPEVNVLVPKNSDPRSKTPAFKSVLVEISAEDL